MEPRLQALQGRMRKGKSVMKAEGELDDLYAFVEIVVHLLDVNNT